MQNQPNIIIGTYTFDSRYCIGQGSFGKVYKGNTSHISGLNTKTNKTVAIKQLDRQLVSQQQINKQIQILKSLQHPNIVKYQDAFKTNQFFYIVTQYCNGGDLRNLLDDSDMESQSDQEINNISVSGNGMEYSNKKNKNKLDKILQLFYQICQGFCYLHKFNIIHRDLKPTNILIHNGVYKIADFGVARTQQLHKSLIHNDLIGVPIYMSPQILSKNFYSYKCDVWSLGVIVYQYYFQKLPWKASDVNNLFFQIMSNPTPYLDQNKKLPSLLKSIFDNTLKYLQKQRMSWQQLANLQKTRKKIFSDNSSKSKHLSNSTQPSPYTDLSASKMHKSIPSFQSQIVHHIICQCQALQSQLNSLVGVQCFTTFLNTSRNYLIQGIQYRQCFVDCSFFILKMAGQNLHLYMMDLETLEQARPLLVMLELIHDTVTMPPNISQEQFKKYISNSFRSAKIDQYAASVISKINTYRLKVQRQF